MTQNSRLGFFTQQQNQSTSHTENIIEKTTNLSEIIRNFAASIVESKLLEFCNTEAS